MIGNPGTGKTHLAIGLGMKACMNGYSVRFYTAASLATELVEASDYKRLTKLERQLASVDLLIIDELSYLSFNRHQSDLLFKVISDIQILKAQMDQVTKISIPQFYVDMSKMQLKSNTAAKGIRFRMEAGIFIGKEIMQ